MKFSVLLLSVALMLFSVHADAKRMGGGRSVGKQSNNVSQREASPQAPVAPAQNAGNRAAGTPPTAAPAPKRPWGAMLGGIAAGLGLAWLAHSLGLGAAMGQVLMFILLAVGVMLLVGWWVRRRNAAPVAAPYAFQGANQAPVYNVPNYRPENVGNDASARPFERSNLATDLTPPAAAAPSNEGNSMIGSALLGSQSWGVPAGFDTAGFLAAAKRNFVTLQAAWDRSDIASLRSMMTDGMLSEIKIQLSERETHTGSAPNITEVEMLEARLLGIEEMATEYMASVEFSGMIREDRTSGPNPFREVWNMTKSKNNGNGWLVAGVQALQ